MDDSREHQGGADFNSNNKWGGSPSENVGFFKKKHAYRRYKGRKSEGATKSGNGGAPSDNLMLRYTEYNNSVDDSDNSSAQEQCVEWGGSTHDLNDQSISGGQSGTNGIVEQRPLSTSTKNYGVTFNVRDIRKKRSDDLLAIANELAIENLSNMQKPELLFAIMQRLSAEGGILIGDGTLEILQEGYGFLRSSEANYIPGADDVYISPNQIRRYSLRTGDAITGILRAPKRAERYFAMNSVSTVNDMESTRIVNRRHFDDLTPLYPNRPLTLEHIDQNEISSRVVDIVTPLGKGQRALIVAPPRTGKTILIQNIAHAITSNFPEIKLIVLLIDERPEEVTDMLRSVHGEVVSSTFDEPSHRHVQLSEMVIEKSKRFVEAGHDVVILLDSITRLARAYNNISPSSGKVLSGGVDSNALQRPKRFFGAARNTEEGGSLTIIATALIETGSRMDEVIFEEFKGTGNSEIILDRKLSDRRIFPAIDITKSGTRKEELLVDRDILTKMWVLRRLLNPMSTSEAMEFLMDKLKNTESNSTFFCEMDTNTYKQQQTQKGMVKDISRK